MMNADPATAVPDVLVERIGSLGRIVLNRPKALNSLTLGMVRAVDAALDRFQADPDVAAILITGAGERGLCAGGDIRMIFESGKAGDGLAEQFWREEYRLNARISHYPKPYIALLDGITMGGGVGISAHGSHRLATERLRLAMPETGIGYFPDVGATWLLTRQPGEIGTYLGLTGAIVGAGDAIDTGLADLFLPSTGIETLVEQLAALPAGSGDEAVNAVLSGLARPRPEPVLSPHRPLIDRAFSYDTVEAILADLAVDPSAFAAETLATLKSKSPSSLKIALGLLRRGRTSPSLEQCLNCEFAGSAAILGLDDFYEGVRAAVIDKDRNPKWNPDSLDQVTPESIAHFFADHAEPPFGRN